MSEKVSSIRYIIMGFATIIFASTLFDALYGFKNLIKPGISLVYNAVGTQLAPNMVTLVVFDWRAFDTLGESLILVTAVLVVLLVFGKGKILDKNINADAVDIGSSLAPDAEIGNGEAVEIDSNIDDGDDE